MGPSPSGELAAEAERLLRKSIVLNSSFWESEFELGVLLESKKDFVAAARNLKRAVQLNPKAPAPHYRLARVYDRLGNAEAAQVERVLHEKLVAEERTVIEKHAASLKRLELVVK
jgi:Flp pilus assembly protein TadD